ncbi:DNA-processing protein DprA [Shewanella sp. NIFS-20-20]|uniref:DNA-processing protein DprA n=1 Tax=Shewanella sp. NIFS-20-20 TaxID=2853806 RepID=UPI001C45F4B9|nr:DNA-processing protein DprA [Shewanella sp. NIFS-20-20]MBV7315562.1 DNA-processing protein DprA [Shewanella sp. NIFS-20-20]
MSLPELRQRLESDIDSLPLSNAVKTSLQLQPQKVDQALAWQAQSRSHHIIDINHGHYPPLLKKISDPPLVLFAKGDCDHLLQPCIALVGSRQASLAGKAFTYDLSAALVTQGLAISSGMAAGIDGVAHQGALAQKGSTVAVLGTGVDVVYPKRHHSLYHQIAAQGCLISEYWPGTQAFAGNFPRRNRIIAGMSLGVVVTEARLQSGSLVTARLALEQGREVFAVPGSVASGDYEGCHYLIQQGAKLVQNSADIIEELHGLGGLHLQEMRKCAPKVDSDNCQLPFASLLASVKYEATSIDEVIEHSGKPVDLVLEQLLELELQGWVAAVPGGYVRLKRN